MGSFVPGTSAPVQALLEVNGAPVFMALSSLAGIDIFMAFSPFIEKDVLLSSWQMLRSEPQLVSQATLSSGSGKEGVGGWWVVEGLSEIYLSLPEFLPF